MATRFVPRSPASLVQEYLLLISLSQTILPIFGLHTKHVEFRTEGQMKKAMMENALIPEIMERPPPHSAEFIFVTGAMADFGNKLDPEDVFEEPRVIRYRCEEEEKFTIIMTDYDAPSRSAPLHREWLHWLVGNCENENHLVGDLLAEYVPINPQRATGFHRYIFTVYKQPGNKTIKFTEEKLTNTSETGRPNFSTQDFANKYNLGEPFALNFFLSEWKPEEKRTKFVEEPCFA